MDALSQIDFASCSHASSPMLALLCLWMFATMRATGVRYRKALERIAVLENLCRTLDRRGRDGDNGQFLSSNVKPTPGGDGGSTTHPSFNLKPDFGPGHSPRRVPVVRPENNDPTNIGPNS